MAIMYKHIYLNFGVISIKNKEMVTFIQLHSYKFGLVYMNNNGELTEISKETEQKDLRVLIDDKLKLAPHIQAMVKKTNRNLGIIKRTFSYLDKAMFLNLYKALVRPHFEYASTVWPDIYKK